MRTWIGVASTVVLDYLENAVVLLPERVGPALEPFRDAFEDVEEEVDEADRRGDGDDAAVEHHRE